eukprot:9466593-Pyramimonas_sp.AAC.1
MADAASVPKEVLQAITRARPAYFLYADPELHCKKEGRCPNSHASVNENHLPHVSFEIKHGNASMSSRP